MQTFVRVSIKLSTLREIDKQAAARLKELKAQQSAEPILSQTEWMIKTPEGRQFNHDCMMHKYARMEPSALRKLAHKLYVETYRSQVEIKNPLPSLADIRNDIISKALEASFEAYPKLAVDNTNKR